MATERDDRAVRDAVMAMTPERWADIRQWTQREREMCPATCLVVADLIAEVEQLRTQVTRLLADVTKWQRLHEEACAQIAASLTRAHVDEADPKASDW